MTTDTNEKGLESLICASLTGKADDPVRGSNPFEHRGPDLKTKEWPHGAEYGGEELASRKGLTSTSTGVAGGMILTCCSLRQISQRPAEPDQALPGIGVTGKAPRMFGASKVSPRVRNGETATVYGA